MRVLYLAHRIPYPPNKGDKIRAYHEIRGLAARGHEVHVAAFVDDPADLQHRGALEAVCASVTLVPLQPRLAALRSLAALATAQPLSLRYFASTAMRQQVQGLIAKVDPAAVVVYCSAMTQYVPPALASRTVVDLVDADSEKWREYAAVAAAPAAVVYGIEARRLRAHERQVVRLFGRSLVTTPREAALIDPASVERLQALPNGVDLDAFNSMRSTEVRRQMPAAERGYLAGDRPRVVFTGAMDYFANIDAVSAFARDVWPAVHARLPRATFLIVGARPAAQVRRLGREPGIVVTGTVADMRPYLAAASLAVVPLRIARGIQNKVLEAMAMEVPVVVSAAVAASVGAAPGRDFVVAASAPEFAGAVTALLTDQQARVALAHNGRRFVERHHQWESMLDRFVRLVESVAVHEEIRCA